MQKLTTTKPLFILLYGSPGSGKTNFARQLCEVLPCAHLQSDRIRAELFEKPSFSTDENEVVDNLNEFMAEQFLQAGVSVILDENADRAAKRMSLRNMARSKKAEPVLVWLQTDFESAYARLQRRDRRKADDKYAAAYSTEMFKQAISRMQNPKNEDYVVISGKHTFNTQRNTIVRHLVEKGLVERTQETPITKPGLVNLVPQSQGRVNMARRNVLIR
jgi:predicted kinase